MIDTIERREDSRHSLRAFAELANANQVLAAQVLDISAQGARIALLNDVSLFAGDTLQIKIKISAEFNPEGIPINLHLNGIIAHQHQHILGIFFQPENDLHAELLHFFIANSPSLNSH